MALSVGSCISSMFHRAGFTEAFAISKKTPLTSWGNPCIGTALKALFNKENKDIITYYDPTFPRRAGLTARADYSILQHHQKVHQHAVMKNDENSTSRKKSRRGNKNIDKRKARYEQWKTLRRNNRRHWRQIKQNGSTALRNLVATFLLYPATQEPTLLANAKTEGVTIKNSFGQTPRKEHYHKRRKGDLSVLGFTRFKMQSVENGKNNIHK